MPQRKSQKAREQCTRLPENTKCASDFQNRKENGGIREGEHERLYEGSIKDKRAFPTM